MHFGHYLNSSDVEVSEVSKHTFCACCKWQYIQITGLKDRESLSVVFIFHPKEVTCDTQDNATK